MPREHHYFVYILASRSRNLYIGVTNNLLRRIEEHRQGTADSFTAKYRIHRLVYFERFQYVQQAITREKYPEASPTSRKARSHQRKQLNLGRSGRQRAHGPDNLHDPHRPRHPFNPLNTCHPSAKREDLLFALALKNFPLGSAPNP